MSLVVSEKIVLVECAAESKLQWEVKKLDFFFGELGLKGERM